MSSQIAPRPAARPRLFRLALAGLFTCAAVAGLAAAANGASGGSSKHNGNAPVNYAADRIEVQDKAKRVVLTGNVDVTQDDLRVRSARSIVNYTNVNGDVQVQRMDAIGNVIVTRNNQTATGDVATYDLNTHIITMVGNVVLHRGTDVSRGARLVVNMDSGISTFVGSGGKLLSPNETQTSQGRVTGTFSVPKKKSTDDKTTGN